MPEVNPTHFENIPAFSEQKDDGERLVNAIIETPRDTSVKYAFEPKYGVFKLKQVLAEGLQWPYDYGFIPQTLADDGDPLDVLILSDNPTFTGCMLECRILGVVRLMKNGIENDRVIAAPRRCPGVSQICDSYNDVDDMPKDLLTGICRFLVEYSEEQGNKLEFKGVKSKKKAFTAIDDAMSQYRKKHSKRGAA